MTTIVIFAIVLVSMVAFVLYAYKKSQAPTAILALALLIAWGARGCSDARHEAAEEAQRVAQKAAAQILPPVLEFPTSGEGHATKEVGLKAYLDPRRTFTRPSGPARYVFAKDTHLSFDDMEGHIV